MANEIEGLDELRRNLKKLDENAQGKAMRTATRKAAKVIMDQAAANAAEIDDPESPQRIADNVSMRYSGRENKETGDHRFKIGVAGGAKKKELADGKGPKGGDTWYWRFVELGIPSRGIAARPFLRKAALEKEAAAVETLSTEAFKAITRHLKRSK